MLTHAFICLTLVFATSLICANPDNIDLVPSCDSPLPSSSNTDGWLPDDSLASKIGDACMFPIIEQSSADTIDEDVFAGPVILRGFMESVLDMEHNWSKSKLLELFGDRVLKVGFPKLVAASNGFAVENSTFKRYFAELTNPDYQKISVDYSILGSVPELEKTFDTPSVLSWPNKTFPGYRPYFAVGPSLAGLPFYEHGAMWEGVVVGKKKWFVYPPGLISAHTSKNKWADLGYHYGTGTTAQSWYTHVLPSLNDLPYAELHPSFATESLAETLRTEFRPLECLQMKGDIIVLPALWTHLTVNVGEVLSVGVELQVPHNVDMLKTLYKKDPTNLIALQHLSILETSKGHLAMNKEAQLYHTGVKKGQMKLTKEAERAFQKAKSYLKKIIAINPGNLDCYVYLLEILTDTRDSFFEIAKEAGKAAESFFVKEAYAPVLSQYFVKIASMLLKTNRREHDNVALTLYEKALEADPRNVWALTDMALIFMYHENTKKMDKAVQDIKNIDPNHVSLRVIHDQYVQWKAEKK